MVDDPKHLEFLHTALQTQAALEELSPEWLPTHQRQRLDEVVEHWRDPLDRALVRLTPKGGARRDWLNRLQEGSQSVRDGLTACHYHVSRIEQIEDEIIKFCEARGEVFREGHDTSFRMPSMSAEYAALQFALRRTLDYMAITIGAFFCADAGSFRRLGRTVEGKEPKESAEAVRGRLVSADLSSVLGNETGHSVRDQLAHHQAVEKAWFGAQRVQGELRIRYSSEVEDIAMVDDVGSSAFLTTPRQGRDLSQAVASKLASVEAAIFGLYIDMGLLDSMD